MNNVKQFIEDAVKGGWKYSYEEHEFLPDGSLDYGAGTILLRGAFLDPLVWKAVGKTRGWLEHTQECWGCGYDEGSTDEPIYHTKWHHFIDHLIDGLSIDEALEKIK